MLILALDIASITGWSIGEYHGVWNLKSKRDESGGMRLIRFKSKLKEMHSMNKIDVCVYERVSGFHKNALIVCAELVGVFKAFCEENSIEYRAYSASEIKKFATGKGNAKKDIMIKTAQEKLGYTGDNDNEADAMWLHKLAVIDLIGG